MFYLSLFYLLSRMKPGLATMTPAQKKELVLNQHHVPSATVNSMLREIFAAETPIGHWLRFPWGTPILGLFKKHEKVAIVQSSYISWEGYFNMIASDSLGKMDINV
jgi:hypothetical protein